MEDLHAQSCFRLFKAEAIRPIALGTNIITHPHTSAFIHHLFLPFCFLRETLFPTEVGECCFLYKYIYICKYTNVKCSFLTNFNGHCDVNDCDNYGTSGQLQLIIDGKAARSQSSIFLSSCL